MSEKNDAIDRKGAWIERMFDRIYAAVKENPLATLLVLSVGLNFMQYQEAKRQAERWRVDITTLNEKINAAVEKRVEYETTKQMAPLKKNVDTSLINVNGTVETIKEYFNSRK